MRFVQIMLHQRRARQAILSPWTVAKKNSGLHRHGVNEGRVSQVFINLLFCVEPTPPLVPMCVYGVPCLQLGSVPFHTMPCHAMPRPGADTFWKLLNPAIVAVVLASHQSPPASSHLGFPFAERNPPLHTPAPPVNTLYLFLFAICTRRIRLLFCALPSLCP
jgi:hypothetical protein